MAVWNLLLPEETGRSKDCYDQSDKRPRIRAPRARLSPGFNATDSLLGAYNAMGRPAYPDCAADRRSFVARRSCLQPETKSLVHGEFTLTLPPKDSH